MVSGNHPRTQTPHKPAKNSTLHFTRNKPIHKNKVTIVLQQHLFWDFFFVWYPCIQCVHHWFCYLAEFRTAEVPWPFRIPIKSCSLCEYMVLTLIQGSKTIWCSFLAIKDVEYLANYMHTLLATKIARKLEICEVRFWVDITNQAPSNTPWKFNCEVFFLKSYLRTQKERIVFQPSFFRGELSNFESVIGLLYYKLDLPNTSGFQWQVWKFRDRDPRKKL